MVADASDCQWSLRLSHDISLRIEQSFVQHRDRTALRIDGEYYSYRELQRRTLAIQSLLDTAAHQPLIGVGADDSIDTYASVLAILRTGRAFVPINPHHPVERNANILEQAGVKTLLVASEPLSALLSTIDGLTLIQTKDRQLIGRAPELTKCATDDLAYLLFTSGSTGAPKGVPISRGNLSAFLDALDASGHGLTETDRVLQMFDLTFDFSVASYLAPLTKGSSVYTVPSTRAKFAEVYRLLEEEGLTVAPMVPSILNYLRPYFSDIQLPKLRLTILCGEALFADVADEWARCAPASRIANFYGPTEATVFAMVYEWIPGRGKTYNGIVSIGRPMNLNMVLVVDSDLQPVRVGEKGELCLAGPQVTNGYWHDAVRSADAFFGRNLAGVECRFYRTGDIVSADAEGDHYFRGRMGTQIKLEGFRVELGEIEYHARTAAQGCECVVIPHPDKSGSIELNLIVENYRGDPKTILTSLRARVPTYMVPKRALSVEKLPMNLNGKIDRVALASRVDEDNG